MLVALATPAPGQRAERVYIQRLAATLASDPSFKVRLKAAIFLGRAGDKQAVAPLMLAMEEDPNSAVRAAAAQSLGGLGFEAAIPSLIAAAATDGDPLVRGEARHALNRLPHSVLSAETLLTSRGDRRIRAVAATLLRPEDEDIVLIALADEAAVRAATLQRVATWPSEPRRAVADRALQSLYVNVRVAGAELLAQGGGADAANRLVQILLDPATPPPLARAAQSILPRLQSVLDMRSWRARALAGDTGAIQLLAVCGDEQARTILQGLLHGPDPAASAAARAMAEMGDPSAIAAIERRLTQPLSAELQIQLQIALQRLKHP
jgi:HEAT repeat protein